MTGTQQGAGARLSRRECEILVLIAQGLTSAKIADELGCARKTVASHRYRLFAKLGARNAADAVVLFAQGFGL
jgi:DNA-binding CsgD family transcriptional regulator